MKKLRAILLLSALAASACAERMTPAPTEPPTPAGPTAPPPLIPPAGGAAEPVGG